MLISLRLICARITIYREVHSQFNSQFSCLNRQHSSFPGGSPSMHVQNDSKSLSMLLLLFSTVNKNNSNTTLFGFLETFLSELGLLLFSVHQRLRFFPPSSLGYGWNSYSGWKQKGVLPVHKVFTYRKIPAHTNSNVPQIAINPVPRNSSKTDVCMNHKTLDDCVLQSRQVFRDSCMRPSCCCGSLRCPSQRKSSQSNVALIGSFLALLRPRFSSVYRPPRKPLDFQSSGAVWKSWWTSWAPVPNKPTVSVDVKQHFNQELQPSTLDFMWGERRRGNDIQVNIGGHHQFSWRNTTEDGCNTAVIGHETCEESMQTKSLCMAT